MHVGSYGDNADGPKEWTISKAPITPEAASSVFLFSNYMFFPSLMEHTVLQSLITIRERLSNSNVTQRT